VPSTAGWAASLLVGSVRAAGETNLQLTEPLLWAMVAISTAGALVTFSFLVYALWRYRDPAVRRRRYG
jgi:heme/copper-type cytochrome/quinol oxidase subunit 2